MPIMPRFSRCDAGTPPMPSSVIAIGISARSANCLTIDEAFDRMMPWPARMTGRCAELINSRARAIDAEFTTHSGRACGLGAAASQLKSHDDCCASLVMSISTGPGRPLAAMWNASRTAGARSCARVTR